MKLRRAPWKFKGSPVTDLKGPVRRQELKEIQLDTEKQHRSLTVIKISNKVRYRSVGHAKTLAYNANSKLPIRRQHTKVYILGYRRVK